VVWKGRGCWGSVVVLRGGEDWDTLVMADGRARALRVEAARPARATGMSALCAVVSDMAGDKLTFAVDKTRLLEVGARVEQSAMPTSVLLLLGPTGSCRDLGLKVVGISVNNTHSR
jgi:hypothetical protein